jgi:ribulose-phosphate 3-epimerase
MIKLIKIIPAIIAKNQKELDERILKVKDFVDIIQLDFMDGRFVPNNSIDFDFKLPKTDCVFEAHLMINNPKEWVENNYMKVDMVLVHFESCDNPASIIDLVKNKGKRFGFVLNPETPVQKIEEYLDDIDQVLIMTVNPGFYGSPFLPETMEKIKKLRKLRSDLDIEVDGGITDKTIHLVFEAGANMFVSGSYIVKSDDVQTAIDNLKNEVK